MVVKLTPSTIVNITSEHVFFFFFHSMYFVNMAICCHTNQPNPCDNIVYILIFPNSAKIVMK